METPKKSVKNKAASKSTGTKKSEEKSADLPAKKKKLLMMKMMRILIFLWMTWGDMNLLTDTKTTTIIDIVSYILICKAFRHIRL